MKYFGLIVFFICHTSFADDSWTWKRKEFKYNLNIDINANSIKCKDTTLWISTSFLRNELYNKTRLHYYENHIDLGHSFTSQKECLEAAQLISSKYYPVINLTFTEAWDDGERWDPACSSGYCYGGRGSGYEHQTKNYKTITEIENLEFYTYFSEEN